MSADPSAGLPPGWRNRRSAVGSRSGARSASPPAITRMAARSSSGGVSFNMKPLAPARRASRRTRRGRRWSGSGSADRCPRRRAEDLAGRLDPVHHRHPHVHEHHVRAGGRHQLDGLGSVGRLAEHAPGPVPSRPAPGSRRAPGPDRRRPPRRWSRCDAGRAEAGRALRTRLRPWPGGQGPAEHGGPLAHADDAVVRPASAPVSRVQDGSRCRCRGAFVDHARRPPRHHRT